MIAIRSSSSTYSAEERATLGEALASAAGEGTPFVLADAGVLGLFAGEFAAVPAARLFAVEAGEEAKSFQNLEPLIVRLIEAGIRRNSALVVVGGGVTQDIGSFIASVLFRGVRYTLIPTTLLAQCDSCIGSKSSINVGRFKNQLGTFKAPAAVYLVFDLLRTLPEREIQSGIGEIIKLHLVAGEAEWARLRVRLDRYRTGDAAELPAMIWDALRIKKGFIEEDEFDAGRRNLLNYGHTFAHAFESATHYAIPHGIAVTLGVLAATYFSAKLNLVSSDHYVELKRHLDPWCRDFAGALLGTDADAVFAAMKTDKKNTDANIGFILTRGPGHMEKYPLEGAAARRRLGEFLADFK